MQLENSVSDFPYHRFSLVWLPNAFKIMRFPANADVPLDQLGGANLFLARTSDEVSVLCEARQELISDSSHGPLRGFRVAGQLEFELVGGNSPQLFLKCFCLPFWWFAFVLFTEIVN